jgi:hypothetical protein
MSLLSGLLDHMPPAIADAYKPTMANRVPDRPRLVLVERPAPTQAKTYTNAANATPEWRKVRDQYVSHVMACPGCYAPTGRHCIAGADLRAAYDSTSMGKATGLPFDLVTGQPRDTEHHHRAPAHNVVY